MRARGAEATDIVVLVVAADDGVMPQTIEALNHAKAADVPIVVAINKIDREQAQPDRVMQQLSEHGLIPQDWGGDIEMIQVSALNGDGIDDLLETLLLVADVEDLRANPDGRAAGVVLESHLDIGRGPGRQHPRAARHPQGRRAARGRSGLGSGPGAHRRPRRADQGSRARRCPSRSSASTTSPTPATPSWSPPTRRRPSSVAETREHWHRVANLGREAAGISGGARLEDIFEQIQRGEAATLNLVLKADTTGSLEALTESLRKLERDEVKLAFVHRAVGGITQQDVQLAATSNATIIGFNVRPDRKARELADARGRRDPELRDHLPGPRGHRERHARHARPRVRRGGHRRGRGPRDLLGAPRRQDRRLLRPQRHDHPRLEGPLPPRGHDHLEGRGQLAAALQGRRARGAGRASSAASASPTSRTSSRATSSRPSRSARSPGRRRGVA